MQDSNIGGMLHAIRKTLPLPLAVACDGDVRKAMQDYLKHYQALAEQHQIDPEMQKAIGQQCDKLTQVFDSFIRGYLSTAIHQMKNLLKIKVKGGSVVDYFTVSLDPQKEETGSYAAIQNQMNSLFRARLGDHYNYSPLEMFHIPYPMRHKVKSQRFSIAGLPCLYLGSSSLLCWEEMSRPRTTELHISRYQLVDAVCLFNLAYDVVQVLEIWANPNLPEEAKRDWATRFLLVYPLLAACSIVVKEKEDRSFRSEYIIPQVLMLAIREEKSGSIDGIRYLSMKRDPLCSPNIWVNYAFIPKGGDFRKDYSANLMKLFFATTPYNLQNIMDMDRLAMGEIEHIYLNIPKGNDHREPLAQSSGGSVSDFYDIVPVMGRARYRDTSFGAVDRFLSSISAWSIEELNKKYQR